MNPFELEELAKNYDDFYTDSVGQMYDRLEKNAIFQLLIEIYHDISTPGFHKTMLEIGSGTGHWTEYFANLGFKVLGIEPSVPMIQIAKAKKINSATFLQESGESFHLTQNGNLYDVLCFIASLEFMDSPVKVIEHAFHYLKPQGHIIVGVLNNDSFLGSQRKTEGNPYREAHFFVEKELNEIFRRWGEIKMIQCAFPNPNQWEQADEIERKQQSMNAKTGNFIACRVDFS